MLIGYARVSTRDKQDPLMQVNALQEVGCEKIYEERESSGKARPVLQDVLSFVREGDTIVCYKMDRICRSLRELLNLLHDLESRGVQFRSITEQVDTSTPAGRMMMQMLGAFAEFEREVIKERVNDGLAAARRRGQKLGRKRSLTPEQEEEVVRLVKGEGRSKSSVSRLFGVSRTTVDRALERSMA